MTLRGFIRLFPAVSVLTATGVAQSLPATYADSTQAILVISTSPESAWVIIDTTVSGITPCSFTVSAPGRHRVRIQHPDVTNWLSGTVDDTLDVVPGQKLTRMYVLETWILIVSSPMGAEILAGDSVLGVTPLIVRPGRISSTAPLTVRLSGYEKATANLGMAARGIVRVALRARPDVTLSFDQPVIMASRQSHTRLYIAGGVAILAGAASAYFKVKADNANNEYLLTNDPAFSSDRNRFDTTSGVFLVVTQASLGLFLAFLMSE